MKKSIAGTALAASLGVGALALTAAAVIGATHTPSANAANVQHASQSATVAAASVVPALAQPQSAADALPIFLQKGGQSFEGIDPKSARGLGADNGVQYWATLRADGDICLIVLLPGEQHIASESCSSPADITTKGLGLQIVAPNEGQALDAYLIPLGYAAQSPYRTVSAQLIVGDAAAAPAPKLVASTPSSHAVTPDAFSAPDKE